VLNGTNSLLLNNQLGYRVNVCLRASRLRGFSIRAFCCYLSGETMEVLGYLTSYECPL
jgi:hypothetical protein